MQVRYSIFVFFTFCMITYGFGCKKSTAKTDDKSGAPGASGGSAEARILRGSCIVRVENIGGPTPPEFIKCTDHYSVDTPEARQNAESLSSIEEGACLSAVTASFGQRNNWSRSACPTVVDGLPRKFGCRHLINDVWEHVPMEPDCDGDPTLPLGTQ